MKRKILVTLLAFCLIASLCVVGAAAADPVAQIGDKPYDTLSEAFENVKDGETIKLLGDVTLTDYIDVRESETDQVEFTLDLGTHKLSSPGIVLRIFNSDVTITNGTVETTYSSDTAGRCTTAIWCRKNTTLTIAENATISAAGTTNDEGNYGVGIWNDGNDTHVIIDGTITGGNGFTINGQLTNTKADVSLEVNGTINVKQCGLYLAGYGKTVINDSASITGGKTGVEIRAGELDVNGGTITGGNNYSISSNSGGPSASGAGIAVSQHGTKLPISVKITDGEISGAYAVAEDAPETGANTNIIDVSITGGEFKATVANNEAVSINGGENILDITGGTFKKSDDTASDVSAYFPENTAMEVDKDTGKVVPSSAAVAEVNNVPYRTLQAAIDAAEGGDTVTLVADVTDNNVGTPTDNADGEQTTLIIEKDITINGNNHSIALTVPEDSGVTRNQVISVGHKTEKPATLTLNDVDLTINGKKEGGDAFDVWAGSALNVNNSKLTFKGLTSAFTMQGGAEAKVNITNTRINGAIPHGNFSNGGAWVIEDSNVTITNCATHGLSVGTAVIDDSIVSISNAAYCGIMGTDISIINGSTVTVTGSGSELPQDSQWAPNGDAYNYAVELKKNGKLTVEDSILTLSGNVNENGAAINNIFVSEGTTTDTANGTVYAGFAVVEGSNQLVVRMMDGNVQYSNQTVTKGDSVYLPTLSKSGYTFTGWRVNNSNTIVRGGESYTITANTTFTAVWNMIMIPDTYDIAVDQPAHGTVDVSFSNASQGSVITVTATPDEGYELVYITVDGEPISGSSFVMPDHAVEVSALFAEIGKEVNFVDVSRADWFYDYVQYVAQNGLMEGTTRTAFEPNASMTRAMFWTVLARIDGETITGDAWKTLAQTWAVESGISDGTNADALITREQMVTMLYRYAGSPVAGGMAISEFTDSASVSDYATDAVTWALSEGILTGMGDGILAPQGTATRAQAAAMLMRFVEA